MKAKKPALGWKQKRVAPMDRARWNLESSTPRPSINSITTSADRRQGKFI